MHYAIQCDHLTLRFYLPIPLLLYYNILQTLSPEIANWDHILAVIELFLD